MKMKKMGLMIMAVLLALSLGIVALAEDPAGTAAETLPEAGTVTETASDTTETDAAQAEANALKEALEAFSKARVESRTQSLLDSLKQELDGYVAAGKLTQDQADKVYQYYVEQVTLSQNSQGFGRGSKGFRNGQT